MKTKFKSAWHRKTFTEFITANVHNPYSSRNEYVAAVFLLSADKFLWKRARSALTGYSINFGCLNLSGISTEGYALFMTAKACARIGCNKKQIKALSIKVTMEANCLTERRKLNGTIA